MKRYMVVTAEALQSSDNYQVKKKAENYWDGKQSPM